MTGDSTCPRVGIIGLGHMGGEIALRLLRTGIRPLYVHDTRDDAAVPLVSRGAEVSPDPATLGAACQVVLLSLPSHIEVAEVIFGEEDGLLRSLKPGTAIVNLTTGSVDSQAQFAGIENTHGVFYVTAPVSQGVRAAAEGRLTTFVFGSEEGCQLAGPILAAFCSEIIRLRDHQAAMSAKLISNHLWFLNVVALAEVLVVAARSGIPLEDARRLLRASCGNNWVVENDFTEIENRSWGPSFTLGLALKDLDLFIEFAMSLGVPAKVAEFARQVFGRAAEAYGLDGPELLPILLAAERAGITPQLG